MFRSLFFVGALAVAVSCNQTYALPPDGEKIPSDLLQAIESRDVAVRRLSYKSVTRYFQLSAVAKEPGESDDEFVIRCASLAPEFAAFTVPITVARDFNSGSFYIRFGEIGQAAPKFEEYLRVEKAITSLMGTVNSAVQATIGGEIPERFLKSSEGIPRLDILAFRPIADVPLATVLKEAASPEAAKFRDPWKRPPISVSAIGDLASPRGWTVNLRHREPVIDKASGKKGHEVLFRRLDFMKSGTNVVISRIDELDVIGDHRTLPLFVSLLEDYRPINGVAIPHKMRCFRFGDDLIRGSVTEVMEIAINDEASFPDQLQIPNGTAVTDHTNHRKFRTSASGELEDARVIESVRSPRQSGGIALSGRAVFWLIVGNGFLAVAIIAVIWRVRRGKKP